MPPTRTERPGARGRPSYVSRVTFGLALLVPLAAPFLFGSVEPWAFSLLTLLALTTAAAALLMARVRGAAALPGSLLLPAVGIMLVAVLQLTPMPQPLLRLLSPEAAEQHRILDELMSDERPATATPLTAGGRLSEWLIQEGRMGNTPTLSWGATRGALVQLLGAAALFLALHVLLNRRERIRTLAWALIGTAFVLALVGIAQKGIAPDALYGLLPVDQGTPFGPFVNRNHFAGYLLLGTPFLLAAMLLELLPELRTAGRQPGAERVGRSIALVAVFVTICGALLATLSRGGIGGLAAVLLVFALLIRRAVGTKKSALIAGVGLLLAMLGMLWMGASPVFQRLAQTGRDQSSQIRFEMWQNTLAMASGSPVLGIGLGSFKAAYPPHKTVANSAVVSHPENEYLEILAETGAVGLLLFLALLAGGVALVFRASRHLGAAAKDSRRAKEQLIWLAAAAAGLTGVLVQCLVDFDLRIPAISFTAVAVAAAAAALSREQISARPWRPGLPALLLLLLLAGLTASEAVGTGLADLELMRVQGRVRPGAADADLAKALSLDAGATPLRRALASVHLSEAPTLHEQDPALARERMATAVGHLVAAAHSEPSNARVIFPLGWTLAAAGSIEQESTRTERGLALMHRATELDPREPYYPFSLGLYLYSSGPERRSEAANYFKQALELDLGPQRRLLQALVRHQGLESIPLLDSVVPDGANAQFQFGQFLLSAQQPELAREAFKKSLEVAKTDHVRYARYLQAIAESLYRHGLFEDALVHFQTLAQLSPTDTNPSIRLARCLVELDRIFEARQLLKKVSRLHGSANALNTLGWLELKENRLSEAEEFLQRALDAEPANSRSLALMASVYEIRGDKLQAYQFLRRAVRSRPDDKRLRERLAHLQRYVDKVQTP